MSKLIKLPGGPHVRASTIVEVTNPVNMGGKHWSFNIVYCTLGRNVTFVANMTSTMEDIDGSQVNKIHEDLIELINRYP